jgi:N-acetylglucosamine-6-sulfatase
MTYPRKPTLGGSARGVHAIVLLVSVASVASVASWVAPAAHAGATPPNIVLIVTDDQRWDTLWAMPNTSADLVDHGIEFTHAHVVTPLCCPSRAAIFTGQYSHTTGVYGNDNADPNGGFNAFDDSTTIATVLHDAGYRTALAGKYLNGYGFDDANEPPTYVPPGWDDFQVLSDAVVASQFYYGYQLNENGTLVQYGNDRADYFTDVTGQKAVDAIRAAGDGPFFVEWAPTAPHGPATPAPEHASDFEGLAPWRPSSYSEPDVTDKPAWVQALRPLSATRQASIDAFRRSQYQALQTVDEWVGRIVQTLSDRGLLDHTMIVLTSDNGFLWGEHRMFGKNVPYEEATRVPLIVRDDALGLAGTSSALSTNIDFAPTFAELAGTVMPNADGVSMLPFLSGQARGLRREHLIEQQAVRTGRPAWCALQRSGTILTHYGTGEEEFYNVLRDPLELNNRIASPKLRPRIEAMRQSLHSLCDPLPPGMPAW